MFTAIGNPGEETLPGPRRWRASGLLVDEWLIERRPPRDLADRMVCTWRGDIGEAVTPLPDECVDVYWVNGSLWVSGPETRSWRPAAWPGWPGRVAVGVRFLPGVAPTLLGVPASELRDLRVPLGALFPDRLARELAERMSDAEDDGERAVVLEEATRSLSARGRDPDPVALAVSANLRKARTVSARDLAREVGLSERQLHRRCTIAFGYGPAYLVRINRIQRFLRLVRVRSGSWGLVGLAVAAGYFDQSHLCREVRSVMGTTPAELVQRSPKCLIGARQEAAVGAA